MERLLHSSKFWLLVFDVIVSLAVYFVTKYASPASAEDALYVIGLMQPICLYIIKAGKDEDLAAYQAGVAPGKVKEPLPVIYEDDYIDDDDMDASIGGYPVE